MRYKITIEDTGRNESVPIECDNFILSASEKRKNGKLYGGNIISESIYDDLCRLYTSLGAYIHKAFTELVEAEK